MVQANFHRYVIDANRDPTGQSLYPGQNTTGLCPLTDFDGEADLSVMARSRTPTEIAQRDRRLGIALIMQALEAEIARVKATHGFAILFDCHSIRSRIPFLFEGDAAGFQHRHQWRHDLRPRD